MLIKAKTLTGYKLQSLDGEIGNVEQFYFDDNFWTVRYMVANTGNWLNGRLVLISPQSLKKVNTETKTIEINLTKKQIEDSPAIETDKPVSRQYETAYYNYYGWPTYWTGAYMWGAYPYIWFNGDEWGEPVPGYDRADHHLRSTRVVHGYHIEAADGEIGHVSDFIIDDSNWAIRYLEIGTSNFWPGKHVLIAPSWIDSVSWVESEVRVSLTRAMIQNSPEYTEKFLINRDYENSVYGYYNRKGYWIDEEKARQAYRDRDDAKQLATASKALM